MSGDGVYKRGKKWAFLYEGVPDEKGNRKRHYKGNFATKKQAKEARDDLKASIKAGTHVEPIKQTVATYLLDEWLPGLRLSGDVRPSTLSSYEMLIRQHIVPKLGGTQLQALNVKQINDLYKHLLTEGRSDGKGALSRKSVRNVHALLRKALADAVRSQTLNRNPAEFAGAPKVRAANKEELKTWDAAQLGTFLTSMKDTRLYPLFHLLACTGMRRGEVLGLRWEDVSLEPRPPKPGEPARPYLSVVQTLVTVDYEIVFSRPKTKKGERFIDLDERTVAILRSWRKRQLEELFATAATNERGLVFTKVDGTPLHPDFISQTFDRAVKRSGLPRIRLHDLRHSYATISLSSGVHAKVVSERLGHSTVAFTLDVYSHSVPALQADAAQKIADIIFGEGP